MNLEPSKGRTSKKAPKNKAQKCGESGASKTFATPSQNVVDVPIFAPDKPVDMKTSDATIAHVKVECKIKSRKGGSRKTALKEISLKESNSVCDCFVLTETSSVGEVSAEQDRVLTISTQERESEGGILTATCL